MRIRVTADIVTAFYIYFRSVYAVIMEFKLIIYHVKLPGTKDSWKSNGLTLPDQNLGSSEARDPAKFTTVVLKDENLAVRGAACSSSWEHRG